jgi:hypothetical protein
MAPKPPMRRPNDARIGTKILFKVPSSAGTLTSLSTVASTKNSTAIKIVNIV